MNRAWIVLLGVSLLGACTPGGEGDSRLAVVAAFYPLAFAAERIGGPGTAVIDLTPPGSEAHDVELSLEDRAAVEEADVILYLGDIGFQPQIERAAADATGRVVAVGPPGVEEDPHFWLAPERFARSIRQVADGLAAADPGGKAAYEEQAAALEGDLAGLHEEFRGALTACEHSTMIVTHEAFGWTAQAYGVEQMGLAGISPEGEPTADRLREAERLVDAGQAGAVFYEETAEGFRTGRAVADDLGVPALPLSTLESRPPRGDYPSVMRDNLESLVRGLGCAS
jgi:zinc transport system substrate-binding protein